MPEFIPRPNLPEGLAQAVAQLKAQTPTKATQAFGAASDVVGTLNKILMGQVEQRQKVELKKVEAGHAGVLIDDPIVEKWKTRGVPLDHLKGRTIPSSSFFDMERQWALRQQFGEKGPKMDPYTSKVIMMSNSDPDLMSALAGKDMEEKVAILAETANLLRAMDNVPQKKVPTLTPKSKEKPEETKSRFEGIKAFASGIVSKITGSTQAPAGGAKPPGAGLAPAGRIKVQAPDGRKFWLLEEQWPQAQKKGYVRID